MFLRFIFHRDHGWRPDANQNATKRTRKTADNFCNGDNSSRFRHVTVVTTRRTNDSHSNSRKLLVGEPDYHWLRLRGRMDVLRVQVICTHAAFGCDKQQKRTD